MLGIGLPELVVIALVALVLIRPEDLPAFFRAAGRLYAKAKKAYEEVAGIKDDFIRAVNEAAGTDEDAEAARGDEGQAAPEAPPSKAPAEGESAGQPPA